MANYTVKRNDQGIGITIPLEQQDPETGAWGPFDFAPFAGGVAKLILKKPSAPALIVIANMEDGGNIGYTFDTDDLDVEGEYQGEVQLTSADGTIVETVPNDGYFSITVKEDLG